MGSAASLLLLGAAIVAAVGGLGVWFALKRPAQALQRRQRAEALAAADRYTPAERVSPYGAAPDPCAPGLSDNERVEAMRALLLRGDRRAAEAGAAVSATSLADTEPAPLRDDPMTTSPMAWKPTLPPDEAEEWAHQRSGKQTRAHGADQEHITI